MEHAPRRRGGSFRQDDDDDEVQFLTPAYDEGGPEPLDFSKLDLNLEDQGEEEYDEDEEERQQELIMTRGRSRSRSVHANDDNNSYVPDGIPKNKGLTPEAVQQQMDARKNGTGGEKGPTPPTAVDRSGPLQHREVVALQKGLEEATQNLGKVNVREDEEERMAADAEKRKRMLAAQNHLPSNSAEPARRIKLLLLGDSGVGKSSLINRWTLDSFNPSLTSTVGVNFKSKKVNYNGELMQVQVWDTAGQENFHKITTSYYKGAQGIMLVYDVSDQKSLDNVEYWIKNIKSHASDSVQVVLVGNKIDLRQSSHEHAAATSSSSSSTPPPAGSQTTFVKCVETERGKEIAKKFSVPFFEASAKDSSHVDEAFMTLVHHIIEMSMPKHHMTVRASLQGMDRKSIGSASSPNLSPGTAAGANHNTPPPNNNSSNGNANSNSPVNGQGNILKSLGLKKSNSSPDKATAIANAQAGAGGAGNGHGNGEDKEKCIIS